MARQVVSKGVAVGKSAKPEQSQIDYTSISFGRPAPFPILTLFLISWFKCLWPPNVRGQATLTEGQRELREVVKIRISIKKLRARSGVACSVLFAVDWRPVSHSSTGDCKWGFFCGPESPDLVWTRERLRCHLPRKPSGRSRDQRNKKRKCWIANHSASKTALKRRVDSTT